MAMVASDWTVTRATGDIRYIGNDHGGGAPSYATVIEFHRFLQDLADNASSSGDDELDITDEDPSSRSTDNIITMLGNYNIDDNASEHLFDGSIIQNSGDDIYDGIVNFGNAGIIVNIIQNGVLLSDDWWNSNGGLNADAASGISHRFMLKTRTAGTDVDGRRMIGINHTFGNTYGEFSINGTSRGNNVLALSDATDLNNQTASGTVATWTTIVNQNEGYNLIDVDNSGSGEPYYSRWTKASFSINQLYERIKYLTRDGSVETLYGLDANIFRGVTHQIPVGTPVGTFSAFEPISWTGGTGQMLAIDSVTAGTMVWMQILTGVAPAAGSILITGSTSSATVTSTGAAVSKTVSKPIIGVSTGSAIIGAYGYGILASDLSSSDTLTDLLGNTLNPPNNVSFSVGGLVVGEDRVLVAPWDGSTLDNEGFPDIQKDQLALSTALNGAAETSVVVSAAIPADTPATGGIRIELASGVYREIDYTSWTGSTFTIASTDFSGDIAAVSNNVWIAYLDLLATGTSESFTSVYTADRDLVVLVRDGGGTPIKQFITSALLGTAGGSVTVIRVSDL